MTNIRLQLGRNSACNQIRAQIEYENGLQKRGVLEA
jgi:hypothetical protein